MTLLIALAGSGCGLLGGDSKDENYDVCRGFSSQFISQDQDGLGVTSELCADSPRGEVIDGRCYCHSQE